MDFAGEWRGVCLKPSLNVIVGEVGKEESKLLSLDLEGISKEEYLLSFDFEGIGRESNLLTYLDLEVVSKEVYLASPFDL